MTACLRTSFVCLIILSTFFVSSVSSLYAQRPPPALSLADQYHDGVELKDYLVSEKLDGVRAYWNGEQLLARSGNAIPAPSWFLDQLPAVALDGELWLGRGRFDELSGIIRTAEPKDTDWRNVRFMIFDLPHSSNTFDQRLNEMHNLLTHDNTPWLQLVPQFTVNSEEDLLNTLSNVVAVGGQGLMLRRVGSYYHDQRNDDLLKLEPHYDAEATVVAYVPGKGRLQGMMGSLLLETPEELQFRLGTGFSDEERRHPPPLGSLVTYEYSGLTARGIPRFARYMRLRYDP